MVNDNKFTNNSFKINHTVKLAVNACFIWGTHDSPGWGCHRPV